MHRIAIDARFLLRKQRGMPYYTSMICKGMPIAMPHNQFVLLINTQFEHNDEPEQYNSRLESLKELPNVTIVDIQTDDEISWEVKHLPAKLKELNIDLLHMPGNRVCVFTSVKQIVTFHDAMEWSNLNLLNMFNFKQGVKHCLYSMKVKLYLWFIYFWGMRKAQHILTISHYSEKAILRYFPFVKPKISFVYHGIPPEFNQPELHKGFSEKKGILMLGGDSNQKNCVNAITAWSQLPENSKKLHPLTIAGFTGDETSPIIKTINQLELENCVQIKTWISQEELILLFHDSLAFLFVSKEEGFGFPLLQAMASGTPVVTSTADVLVEIGEDTVLSSHAEDIKGITENLQRLIDSEPDWTQLRDKALLKSHSFTWENTFNEIAICYDKVQFRK